jgi:arylsulfatase A
MSRHSESSSVTPFSRRQFLLSSLGIASCVGATATTVSCARKQRPNILLILVDDWGWTDMGAYGSTFYETPNLDKAASEGVRFTSAYASCPVCSPTRAAVMTGKYPPRLNITDWIPGRPQHEFSAVIMPEDSDHLALEETTIAEVLKPLGYSTASIGKWHLGGEGFGPTGQGFDVNIAGSEKGSPSSYFAPYQEQFPGIENPPEGESLTRRLCDEAEKYLESVKDKPFFLYYPMYAVHTPLQAEPEVVDKYAKKADPRKYQHNPTYAAMIESLDDTVGRLRKKLVDLGIDKKTIVIITSDNGGLRYPGTRTELVTSNHPLRAGKGHLYEGGTRVPFIIVDPLAKSWVEDTPVASIDILPTIAAYAGAPVPKGVDGVWLNGICTGTIPTIPIRAVFRAGPFDPVIGSSSKTTTRAKWSFTT